ncbi:hypothetical protein G6F31_018044 [Rhizopus arrhizus]|nr:hypothetical protein G6F31_018044 [Rhizopus arrhizus]
MLRLVDVAVAAAGVGQVVRGAADVVGIHGGGELGDVPGHRQIATDLGEVVVVPHVVRIAQQIELGGARHRLHFTLEHVGVVAGEHQRAEAADILLVLRRHGHRFQVLAGNVQLRRVPAGQVATGIAGHPVGHVLAAGRGVVRQAVAAL